MFRSKAAQLVFFAGILFGISACTDNWESKTVSARVESVRVLGYYAELKGCRFSVAVDGKQIYFSFTGGYMNTTLCALLQEGDMVSIERFRNEKSGKTQYHWKSELGEVMEKEQ